jgi:hypothetical protein
LLALHRVRFLAELSKRIIRHEQNKTSYKRESRHGGAARAAELLDAAA